jgi:voltage-gated potassium channel
MPNEIKIPFTRIHIGRYLFLLISILLLFSMRPLLEGHMRDSLLINLLVSAILVSGVYAASPKRRVFFISLAIASSALIISWAGYIVSAHSFVFVGKVFAGLFYIFLIIVILKYIFKEKVITGDMIVGAICVYLLLGVAWASMFSITEILHPGSFNIPEGMDSELSHFSYYSFVTLTTLGYGDITPLTATARSLSVLEAITGQLYIAILIARLVGIHIAQSAGSDS